MILPVILIVNVVTGFSLRCTVATCYTYLIKKKRECRRQQSRILVSQVGDLLKMRTLKDIKPKKSYHA